MIWQCRHHRIELNRPLVMGIVNVTPDSFSDGGQFFDPQVAIDHGQKLIAEGADILDIGGESTRPGAESVPLAAELRRTIPVVTALAGKIPISIDTMKAEVAQAALDAGAVIVNDVAGLRDSAMLAVCAACSAGVIVNHMHGTPVTMQVSPIDADVVDIVDRYFSERISKLTQAGISRESICLDPGIGFGKTLPQTLEQLRHLKHLQRHELPVCLGVSRKGFLGQITGRARSERLAATLAVNCFALAACGAIILRVHDVAAHRDAVKMWEALRAPVATGGL